MNLLLFFCKLTAISALLTGYYALFLKDRRFHQYNRFYLLAIPVLSVCLSLLHISLPASQGPAQGTAIKWLQAVSFGSWEQAVIITAGQNGLRSLISWQHAGLLVYLVVSSYLLFSLVRCLVYTRRLTKTYPFEMIGRAKFYLTQEPGTPFSFFRHIFWDDKLELSSASGSKVFRHEMYHVEHGHSADILFLEGIRALFWLNPLFYLVRKELNAVHEFLADQYAAGEENPTGYAELLVWKSAAPYQSKLSTPFFNNQIKRRVHMLLQIDHMRSGYLYRMLAIPLVFVLLCAFGLKQPGKPASLAVTPWSTGYSPADTVPASVLHSINQGDISSITVLKENGIIIIRMKNGDSLIVKINGQNDNLNLGIQSTQNANQAYSTVQVEAEFPGGSAGWAYYLNHTLKYPKYALDHEIQGDVYVQFIVNTDSTVSDLKILSSVSDALSEEAIRIIKSSKWVPATQNGVAVRAFKVQPIKYRLERQ